jgi:hypothetical protein
MKNRYTYKLIVQSEDKRRNTLEMALYVLVAISALLSIWQFAEEPAMPTYQMGALIELRTGPGIPS